MAFEVFRRITYKIKDNIRCCEVSGQRARSRRTVDAAKCSDERKDIEVRQAKTGAMRDQGKTLEGIR